MQGNGLVLDIGSLGDPSRHTAPLDLKNIDAATLLTWHARMLLIRTAEEAIADLIRADEARGPCHLSIGQEAIAVGVAHSLRATDRSFGTHRSHGHYLALGGSLEALLAEILGRDTGCARGRGGSMHIHAGEAGFFGSVPFVGGTIALAAGAAFAAKRDGGSDVGVAFFGDGACEEGIFHETLNLAAIMRLPMLFVVENNLFSSHMDLHFRQPATSQSRFAAAQRVANRLVDGNDVVAVAEAAHELLALCRNERVAALLEAVTYRWSGHVGPNDDYDVGVRRSTTELKAWKRRDPIGRLEAALVASRAADRESLDRARADMAARARLAADAALAAPFPDPASLLDCVYAPRA